MKNRIILNVIKMLVFLMFSVNAYAQRDLTFNSAATLATYSAEQFQTTPVVLNFEVQNIGLTDASDGVDFELRYDDLNFNFNSFSSTLNGWNCTPLPGPSPNTGITCFSNGTVFAGTSVVLNMAFDLGSTAPVAMFNFDGTLIDTGGVELSIDQANNTISTIVDVTAPAVPDLTLVGGITPTNLTFTENDTTPQSVSYRVLNNGGDATLGVDFAVTFDDLNFSLSGPTSVIPLGWICTPTVGVITCSTTSNFAALATADFTFDYAILPLPAAPAGNYVNTLAGNLQDPSFTETNTNDNIFSTSSLVNPQVTDYELTIDPTITTPIVIPNNATGSFPVKFNVKNIGSTEGNSEFISILVDPSLILSNVNVTGGGNNPIWSCSASASGWDCFSSNTSNGMLPGDIAVVTGDITGYPTTIGLISNAIDASVSAPGDTITTNDGKIIAVDIVNAVATTDLNLSKYAKGIIGGSIITNIVQDTQFVYAIQVNNPSVTAANNIVVTDNIPIGIEITAASSLQGNWSCTVGAYIDNFTSQTVTCSLATMAASTTTSPDTIYLTAFGRVSGATPISNTAFISAIDEPDSNTGDNSGFADIIIDAPVTGSTDVLVTTSFDSGFFFGDFGTTVDQGADATFRILADSTLAPASNVTLTAVLPPGTSYVGHTIEGPNFVCTYDNINTVSCTATNLPVTTSPDGMLLTLKAVGTLGTVVNFSASIGAGAGSNSNTGNDTSSPGSFTIVAPPVELDLSITKDAQYIGGTISNNNFLENQSFEYKLVVSNLNANVAQIADVNVYDTLPTGMNLDSVPISPGWDCSATAPPVIDCINTVSIAANGGTLELLLPVSSQAAASYTNTANVGVSGLTNAFENNVNDNSATFTLNVVANLVATTLAVVKDALEFGSPITSVNSGSNYTYRIDVGNTGNANAANIVVTDTIPSGVTVNSTNGVGWSCSNTGQLYTCSFPGPLAPGSNAFVDLNVTEGTAIGTATIQNNVDVLADNASLVSAANTVAVVRPDVVVNVTQNPDPIVENMPFDINIVVTNTGNSSLSGIQVDNTLPAGFSYGAVVKAAANCTVNGLLMSCLVSTPIAAGASETIVVPIQAITAIAPNAVYTNTTVVSGGNITNPITQTYIFNVTQAIVNQFDVGISKTVSATTVIPNASFSYTLAVSNLGTSDVTGLTVIDNLPTGLQLVSISSPNWTCSGTTQVSCNQSTLLAGTTSNIILNVQAPAQDGVLSNTAQVSMAEQDADTSNNMSQANVNIMTGGTGQPAVADLQLTKTTSSPTLVSGEQFSWAIEVLNNGPDTATNVLVNDVLPAGFQLDSVNTTDGTCQTSVSAVDCQIPAILNQDKVTITVMGVASIDSGQLSSIATVTADSTDLVPENNTDTLIVVVNPVPVLDTDLSVSIDNTGSGINQGESSEFMLKVVNHGPDVALPPELNVVVTGILESVTVNQGSDWTCQVQNFAVNCQFRGEQMQNGQQSFVAVTANTTRVVSDAQNLAVTAVVSTTGSDVDSNLANNTATSILDVTGTPSEGDILNALRTALAGTGNTQINRAIESVASYCEIKYFTALEGMCGELYSSALAGERDTINNFMEQITPNEVIGQSTSVSEIASAQFRNVGARLSQLRGGGGGGFSSAGLNARYGNGSIPLGMLSYLNQTDAETDGISQIKDDFITPWGFFVNGSISMGKRDSTGRELGFDFDTYGLTAGFDYRLNARKVIGIALGYANFDSNIGDTAQLNSTGVTLTGYGSFYVTDNFYVDARISYGNPKFKQSREIDFTLGDIRVQRTAAGETNSNQYSVAMSAGYSFYKNSWNITPNASFSYVRTNIDSFTETGAGDFNFIYLEQQWDSLVWSAGLKVSKAISLKKGVITPQFDIDYNYQSKNNGDDIVARFINAPIDELFILETDSPDRTYGTAGLGLVYISANGKQAYINYRSILGLEGFTRGTFNLGARFEF